MFIYYSLKETYPEIYFVCLQIEKIREYVTCK